MLKVTAIGGEPATGKSYIVKKIISENNLSDTFMWGKLVRGIKNDKISVLGIYGDSQDIFPGTDKLSMAVQPEVIQYIKLEATRNSLEHIIFEGDRLFKSSLFEIIKNDVDFRIVVIKCDEEVKEQRHIKRKDEQNEKWLNSRKTAVNNIVNNYNHFLKLNNTEQEANEIAEFIMSGSNEGMTNLAQTTLF
tara:strand:+ start:2669 stop:3241 length:573 start_codon:yes stop_codon:yes gene_type:complete